MCRCAVVCVCRSTPTFGPVSPSDCAAPSRCLSPLELLLLLPFMHVSVCGGKMDSVSLLPLLLPIAAHPQIFLSFFACFCSVPVLRVTPLSLFLSLPYCLSLIAKPRRASCATRVSVSLANNQLVFQGPAHTPLCSALLPLCFRIQILFLTSATSYIHIPAASNTTNLVRPSVLRISVLHFFLFLFIVPNTLESSGSGPFSLPLPVSVAVSTTISFLPYTFHYRPFDTFPLQPHLEHTTCDPPQVNIIQDGGRYAQVPLHGPLVSCNSRIIISTPPCLVSQSPD